MTVTTYIARGEFYEWRWTNKFELYLCLARMVKNPDSDFCWLDMVAVVNAVQAKTRSVA